VGGVHPIAFAYQRMATIRVKNHLFNMKPINQVRSDKEQDPAHTGGGFLLGITP
jgi:hypothetical protein